MNKIRVQENTLINEQIFNVVNTIDHINEFIDLHGQNKDFSVSTVRQRLFEVKQGIANHTITPNFDSVNHIFKISCGAGKHSKGAPVLKNAMLNLLKNENYDHYSLFEDGVFLVRF